MPVTNSKLTPIYLLYFIVPFREIDPLLRVLVYKLLLNRGESSEKNYENGSRRKRWSSMKVYITETEVSGQVEIIVDLILTHLL